LGQIFGPLLGILIGKGDIGARLRQRSDDGSANSTAAAGNKTNFP